jgi:pimeloyl-ACP methyl ester carboxylesterase
VIVFVHGVPETAAIWAGIQARVDRPSVALALPGFGNPRPAGFGATKDDYVDWILGQLDGIEGPIDLVGHDWGAGFAFRIATAHGDRLRSWTVDVGGLAHPEYEWHPFAQIWQTPGEGVAFFEAQQALAPAERAAGLEGLRVPAAGALEMAEAADADMASCILDLYRSATPNIHHEWGPWAPPPAPGLVIHPTEDPFSDATKGREVADLLGAGWAALDGIGHFWPYEAPDVAATLLEGFWTGL